MDIAGLLETYRHQNRWFSDCIRKLNKNLLDPIVVERAFDRLQDPEKLITIWGPVTEIERTDIRMERLQRIKLVKKLHEAIELAKEPDWEPERKETMRIQEEKRIEKAREARKKYNQKKHNKTYNKKLNKLPPLKPGELPKLLCNDKAKELLQVAINGGFLDSNYQPVKGCTKAQLYVITRYAGSICELYGKGIWETFTQLWGVKYKNLKNEKWKPTDGQVSIKRLLPVVNAFVSKYHDIGITPVIELSGLIRLTETGLYEM